MQDTLAVLSCTGQSISFFDVASGERLVYEDKMFAEPHELIHDKKRNILYVSHTYRDGMYGNFSTYAHEISIVDCVQMKVVDTIDVSPAEAPHDFAIDEQGDILWVSVEKISAERGGGLIGIDLKSRNTVKQVECQFETHWFVMTRDGKKAYTCNKAAPFISVLDLEHQRFIGKIEVEGTEQPDLSHCGRYLLFPSPALRFGSLPPNPSVLIIDTQNDQIVRSVPLGAGFGPAAVHVTPTGTVMVAQYCFDTTAAAPTPRPGRVSLYDSTLRKLLGESGAGIMPLTMRATSDGSIGFVANAKGGDVHMIDLRSMTGLQTLDIDVVPSAKNKFQTTAHGMALFSRR